MSVSSEDDYLTIYSPVGSKYNSNANCCQATVGLNEDINKDINKDINDKYPNGCFAPGRKEDPLSNLHKFINSLGEIEDDDSEKEFVKKVNRYLKKHPELNQINTKDLNAEFTIKGHAFSKTNGQQTLMKKYYTPMCRSKTKQHDDDIEELKDKYARLEKNVKLLIEQVQSDNMVLKKMSNYMDEMWDKLDNLSRQSNVQNSLQNNVQIPQYSPTNSVPSVQGYGQQTNNNNDIFDKLGIKKFSYKGN